MLKPRLPVGCGLQQPSLHLICVVLFVPGLLSCSRCSGSLWDHPVLTLWGVLMLVVSSGSQRWASLEKSFPDPTENNPVGTVCSAVAICWLFSLSVWFLPRLGVSVKASAPRRVMLLARAGAQYQGWGPAAVPGVSGQWAV